jgi:hypothetical protein
MWEMTRLHSLSTGLLHLSASDHMRSIIVPIWLLILLIIGILGRIDAEKAQTDGIQELFPNQFGGASSPIAFHVLVLGCCHILILILLILLLSVIRVFAAHISFGCNLNKVIEILKGK